jgi:hypothetical protein
MWRSAFIDFHASSVHLHFATGISRKSKSYYCAPNATETATETLLNISLDLSLASGELFVLNSESKMLDIERQSARSAIDNDLTLRPNADITGDNDGHTSYKDP